MKRKASVPGEVWITHIMLLTVVCFSLVLALKVVMNVYLCRVVLIAIVNIVDSAVVAFNDEFMNLNRIVMT